MPRSSRYFSTAAKVHPAYLPHLRHSRRMPFRWFKPLAAVLALGYGARTYMVSVRERHVLEADRRDAERRRRDQALLDQYGDRDSLEALERAVSFYEKR